MTEIMEHFIQHNKKYKIYFGERLTPEGKPIIGGTDFERSDRTEYRFTDGTSLIIKDADKDLNYKPIWACR